jgi:hypothetical protein
MIDRSSSPPLASNTKKERRKTAPSLGVFFNVVVVIFLIASDVTVACSRVFHGWRRKRWVDDWLGGLKTHRHAYLTLALVESADSSAGVTHR